MLSSSVKPYTLIPIAMLLAVISFWQFTFIRFVLMLILLLFSMVTAFAAILAKYRKSYQQGRITPVLLIRNSVAEIIGLLAIMILAGWLGRAIAQIAAQHIGNELARFITGLITGLLVGISVGIAANQLGGRFHLLKNRIVAAMR